ncbi:MAG TPA: nicotinate-nucleotide adenylyltransferase [Vicinamibacterales bacterium]|jgi:nicotinate-nucleotide adenylyltransferase
MTGAGLTGILGGTFDPVHLGHLAAAQAASAALALDRVLLIPSHHPPHRPRSPHASAFHRFAMVSLAIGGHPQLTASDVELRQPGPSYTAVTLRALHRSGTPASQLFFITGTDAFADIATWHDYPAVLDLAHFIVISRPGRSFDALESRLPDLAPRMRMAESRAKMPAGVVESPRIFLVTADTPDVSSTEIRARARAGQSLETFVPAAVEDHIRRHGLYRE